MYKRVKFRTDRKGKNLPKKLTCFFEYVFIDLTFIMAESWLKYNQAELLISHFEYASQADAQNLVFSDFDAIRPEQIIDINDTESFATPDVFTPLYSSSEETQK